MGMDYSWMSDHKWKDEDKDKKKSSGSSESSKSSASASPSARDASRASIEMHTQVAQAGGPVTVIPSSKYGGGGGTLYFERSGNQNNTNSGNYNRNTNNQNKSQPRAGSSSAAPENATQGLLAKTGPGYRIEGISGIPDIRSDNWYSGDGPNAVDNFARIYALTNGDEGLLTEAWEARFTPGETGYSAYAGITSEPVARLAQLGIEIPQGGLTREWFEKSAPFVTPNYRPSKNSTTGAPTLPKRASKDEQIAYWWYQAEKDLDDTDKAENEMAALREEIAYLASSPKNYNDQEILDQIDWNKYKTLQKMEERAGEGTPLPLVRTIDFSKDYLPGMIWAARNGVDTGSAFFDAVNGRIANYQGGYTADDEVRAKLDPNSDRFSPYSLGSTMEDAGLYYGTYSFDDKWLEEHREDGYSSDETKRRNYARVYEANEFTKKCERELNGEGEDSPGLLAAIEDELKWDSTSTPEEILSRLLEDRPNLKRLDETAKSGRLLDTTRAINYSYNDMLRMIEERRAQQAAEPKPDKDRETILQKLAGAGQAAITGIGDVAGGIMNMFNPQQNPVPENGEATEPPVDQNGNVVTPSPSKSGTAPEMTEEMSRAWENRVDLAGLPVMSDGGSYAYRPTPRPDTTPSPDDARSSNAGAEDKPTPRPDTTPSPDSVRGTETEAEGRKNREQALDAAGPFIREAGTETDKLAFQYGGADAENTAAEVMDAINSGAMTAEQGRDYLHGGADQFAAKNYFGASLTVKDFERRSLALAEKQARLAAMPEVDAAAGSAEDIARQKEAMLLEAMQTGNMDLYDQAQAIGNPDPEAEMLAARRDALEREIAEDQARLDQMRTEVDRANRVIRDAQHLYDIADAAAGVTGQEPSDTLRASEVVDALMAFDTYTTPDWAAYSLYDMMLNEGADYDAVAKGAADTAAKYRQAAERITVTLKAAEQMGIAIPDDYRQNIESARDYYLNGALDGEYLQLRGREDFRSVADAERAKAKENPDPNGIIDRMMGDPFKYGKVDLTFVDPTAQLEQRMAAESRNFTEAERDTYFYLLGTSGKEAADAYYRHLTDNTYGRLNARIADEMMADARAKAAKNGWSAAIETAETSLLSPLANISAASQVVINRLTGTKTNPYMAGFLPQLTAGATRDEVKTMAMNAVGGADSLGGKFAGFWFDAAVSAADSGVNALVSSVAGLPSIGGKIVGGIAGSSIMGLGAGAGAYRDVIEKGGTEDQALLMGAVSFAAETVTEAIELQDILDAAGIGAAAGEGAGKTFLAYMKKQIPELRNEFFGEAVGQAIEGVSEDKILGALSDRQKRIDEAVANDEMLEGARREADMAFWKDVLGAGVMGAASAGLSTTAGYALGRAKGAIFGTPTNGAQTPQNAPETTGEETPAQAETPQQNASQNEAEAQEKQPTQVNTEQTQAPEAETVQPTGDEQTALEIQEGQEAAAPEAQEETAPTQQEAPDYRAKVSPLTGADAAKFQKRLVTLQEAAGATNARTQGTLLSAVFDSISETVDRLSHSQAAAAVGRMMDKIGGPETARMLQDVLIVTATTGDTAEVMQDIQTAAMLDDTSALEALADGRVTQEKVATFKTQISEQMTRPEVLEQIRARAMDQLISEEKRKLIEEGAMADVIKRNRAERRAKQDLENAQEGYRQATAQVSAAQENLRQTQEAFLQNPTDPQAEGNLREMTRKVENAFVVQQQYEQSVANKTKSLEDSRNAYLELRGQRMEELRVQATANAQAAMESANEKRAERAQRQRAQAEAQQGKTGRTYIKATTPVNFHYAAIDVDGLITSNDEAGNRNPDYPQELQPRDRTRTASRAQLETMSRTLNPELLGADNSVTGGAPIVGPDYVVESGNQRTMAIRQAMAQAHSENYTAWLREHAADFGLNPSTITDRSVLVRVRDTDVDRVQFAREANESVTAAMSQTETAGVDAQNMDERLLNLYDVDADGITSASNRDFVASFLQTIPEAERGLYIQEDGSISQAGVTRIRNALFQAAYGDQKLTSALAESTDDSVRNVTTALTNAAPKLATYNRAAENGSRYDMSLSEMIAEAARLYRGLRAKGESVEDWTNQVSMFDPTRDGVQTIMQMFEANARSGKKITRYLTDLIQHAEALGDPNQTMLGGLEQQTQTPDEFIARSFAETEANIQNEAEGAVRGQTTLFDAETRDTVTKQALDNYLAENGITLEGEEYEQELARWQDEARQAEREMQSQQSEMDMQERNRRMQRMRDLARRYSRAFGVEIRFESGRDENGRLIWHGKRDTNTGVIYIDSTMTETELFHRTLLHELTHHVEQTGEYGQLQNTLLNLRYGTNWEILQQNQKNGRLTENDRRLLADIQAKQSLYSKGIGQELTPEEALQEITADATYDIFEGNEQLIRDFVNQDRSLAERVFEWIKNALAKLRGENTGNLSKARDLFAKALQEAESQNGTGRQQSVQYKFRDSNGQELTITQQEFDDNKRTVAGMEPVINVSREMANRFLDAGGNTLKAIENYFAEIGKDVYHPMIGKIELANEGARHIVGKNALTYFKMASVPAIKPVIENGYIVSTDENHGGKPVDTALIAGKATLPDGDYIVGVVIKQHNGGTRGQRNAYTFHDAWCIKKEGAAALQQGRVGEQNASVTLSSAPTTEGTAKNSNNSIVRILQEIAGVNSNAQYSLPEIQQRDTEYQQAVDNGDMETAQRLTDEAAQKAGYTIPVYHGTPGLGGFTEFRRDFTDNGENEFYFSTVRRMAESYAGSAEDIRATGERSISSEEADAIIAQFEQFIAKTPLDYRVIADQDSGTYTLRSDYYDWDIIQTTDKSEFARELARMGADSGMQIENPAGVLRDSGAGVYSLRLNPAGMMEVDAGGANWNQIPTADGGLTTTRELAKQAREQGYSGVHIANIIDYGGYAGIDRRAGDVYIAFSSSQVKNTQPITYDRGGAVIPLSQRFNQSNPDIRYALPSDNNMDAIRRQRVRQALSQQQARQTRGQQQTEIQAQHQSDTRVEDLLQMDPPKRRLDLRPGTLATHIFDKTHPLFKMTQASMQEQQTRIDELKAKQKSGVKLTAEEKAIIKRGVQGYDSSRDVRDLVLAKGNAIANSTEFCLTKHMVDAQGNRVYRADGSEVGSLADILGKIDLKDEKAFNAYWLALYMKERQAAGKEVNRGLTDTAAMDRTIASTEAAHPEWRGIVDEACEWYGQFMQTWLVNEGLVRQSTLDTFRTMYPHYVPVFSGEVKDSAATGRDKNQMQADHLHFAGEGGGSIYNPVMGMAESVQRHIENAKQAEVMRAFGDFFSSDLGRSMGLVQELDPTPAQEKNGAGVGAMEAMSNFQWVTQDPATRQDVLHVPMPDGSVRNFICSDSGIIKALVGTQATGKGLQATARLTGFMCAFATAKNLAFSVQNFLSDGATAMITGNTGGNILTYNIGRLASMFDLARNQIREARGKETSETYQKYQLFGGMGSRYAMRETDVSREFRGKLYKNEVSTIGHIAQFLADVTQFKHVEAISEFLEQATRYNEFSRGNHDLNSYEGLLAAAKAQREVTTDFSKSGDWAAIQYAGQLIPFIRAQMQGTYKTIRMFSEENAGNRGRYMRRIVFNTLVSSAVLAALRGLDWDDEEKKAYEEMNAYEKIKYGHIKIGGKILRIKRTQDGILGFANAVGDMLGDLCNGYEDNDYAQFFDCVEEVAKGLLPSHDTVFEPFMDAANNQTWYGSRIEDAKFDGMAEQDKYESDTLPVFRWASNLSNAVGVTYSPLDWQYICQQYMGSAGRIILGESAGIGGALLDGEEFTPFDALGIAGDEVLGRVAYDPVYSNYASSTFYDGLTMLSGIQATSDNIGQPGHLLRPGISQAEHKQALKEIDRMTSKGGSLYTIRKNLSGLWKKYNAIDANEMLTDSQKEEAKRNMRRQINEQALRGNTIISQFMGRYGRKNLKQKTAEGVLKLLHGE